MNKKERRGDLANKFWKDYIKSDIIERRAKLKCIIDLIDELRIIKKDNVRKYALTTLMQSYFDDLIATQI